MVNARDKGIRYELEVMNRYKSELGMKNAVTARNMSKWTDDKGVDIMGVEPFLPQCKNYKSNMPLKNAIDIIKDIKKNFKEGYPILHLRLTEKRKSVIIMDEKDFFKLINELKKTA